MCTKVAKNTIHFYRQTKVVIIEAACGLIYQVGKKEANRSVFIFFRKGVKVLLSEICRHIVKSTVVSGSARIHAIIFILRLQIYLCLSVI